MRLWTVPMDRLHPHQPPAVMPSLQCISFNLSATSVQFFLTCDSGANLHNSKHPEVGKSPGAVRVGIKYVCREQGCNNLIHFLNSNGMFIVRTHHTWTRTDSFVGFSTCIFIASSCCTSKCNLFKPST